MANIYPIPPQTNEEEKAIGGVLTVSQFIWLLGGAVIGIVIYMLSYLVCRIQILSALFGIISAFSGIPFAFIKKHNFTLYQYYKYKKIFKKKSKKLINRRNF